jgi:integrase
MAAACEAAGLTLLSFHELRHTYASGLVNAGMPPIYVAAQLGHSDTRMVERYYRHLAPTALSEAVRAFSPKLGIFGGTEARQMKTKGA